MPGAPTPGPNAPRGQQIDYYAGWLAQLPGTYQGNEKAYDGLSWPALYRRLASAHPTADPKQLADTVLGIESAQKLSTSTQATIAGTGNSVSAIEQGAANTNFAAGVPGSGVLTGLAAIGDFFQRLTQGNTWVRLAKIVVGGALVLIGLAHMTGADNAAFNAARKVPVIV